MTIHEIPLVRIVIPLIAGIIFNELVKIDVNVLFYGLIALSLLLVHKVFYSTREAYSSRHWVGIIFSCVFFLSGNLLSYINDTSNRVNHYSKFIDENQLVAVRIAESIKEKPNSVQLIVHVENIMSQSTCGKAIVYLEKTEQALGLQIGDALALRSNFQLVQGVKNPNGFDYARFLKYRGITHQTYVASNDWDLLESPRNSIFYFADQSRKKLLSILKESGIEDEQLGVASALLLGSKDDLNYEVMKDYAAAGAMHVLAVSGLHVGIIYLILSTFLGWVKWLKKKKILTVLILLSVLWTYALITGLSPSVMRAATMFSFVVIGESINRKTNIYNTLAASALCLLVYNPYLVFEVGFQLSYLAVIGIVFFQPKIYGLIYTKWWLIDKIWAITAVSIAAQIATLPLTLYYFHQFPVYFMLANVVVIPMATVVLAVGLFLFLVAPWHWLLVKVGFGLNELLHILNAFIHQVSSIPFAIIDGISIGLLELMLLFGSIIFTGLMIFRKRMLWGNLALLSLLSVLVYDLWEDVELLNNRVVVIYDVNKASAIDFIYGNKNYFIGPQVKNDTKNMDFNIRPNWSLNDIKETTFGNWNDEGLFLNESLYQNHASFFFNGKSIVRVDDFSLDNKTKNLVVDYLVLSNNVKTSLMNLLVTYDPKYLVLDGSNSNWYCNRVLQEASELGLNVLDVKNGALVLKD